MKINRHNLVLTGHLLFMNITLNLWAVTCDITYFSPFLYKIHLLCGNIYFFLLYREKQNLTETRFYSMCKNAH